MTRRHAEAAFLPQETVARKASFEPLTDELLDLAIGLADQILRTLGFDLQPDSLPEMLHGE